MKYSIACIVLGLACTVLATSVARVEEKIWENFKEAETTNVKVSFRKANTKAAFDSFHSLKLTSRNARLNTQYAILKDHADTVQADVMSLLQKTASYGKTHVVAQLWISNELVVRNVDKETVEMLRDHPDVQSLEAEWFIQLEDVMEEPYIYPLNNTQWNIVNIAAPAVWATGNTGVGAFVGHIASGVRHTHVALRNTYRGNDPGQNHNYNWFAPTGHDDIPSDTNGLGTHVIGLASGTEGIGVAPGSRWIACRGCPTAQCSTFDLTECGNWMACPTNTAGGAANCTRAPHIVNCSWGGGGNDPWYDAIIIAWRNVQISPIFSAGDFGPGCSTLFSPGDRPLAISVASTALNNRRSNFSSAGPTVDGRLNPLIAAPGASVSSASLSNDVSLRTISGTGMAAAHISGVVALLKSRNRNLTVPQIITALQAGGTPHAPGPVVLTCGGIPDSTFPNNHVGFGLILAPNAVNSVPVGS